MSPRKKGGLDHWAKLRSFCGLSCVRDYSHLFTGSPSLPDKYRHTRELMMLLPTHRDRPSSAMYPAAIMENGQVIDLLFFPSTAAVAFVYLWLAYRSTVVICNYLHFFPFYLPLHPETTDLTTFTEWLIRLCRDFYACLSPPFRTTIFDTVKSASY